jgi:hypothetical protein
MLNIAGFLFVLGCALAYVFAGGSFDAGRFVTAVPVAAVAFIVFAAVGRLLFGAPAGARPHLSWGPRRRANPVAGIAFGVAGVAVASVMSAWAGHDLQAYQSAPSCRAGFGAAYGSGGPCRLVAARIVRAYHTGRHNNLTLDLDLPDGSRHRAVVASNVSGDVWQAAKNGTALAATAQLDGPAIVQVQTAAGQFETSDYPQNRLRQWTVLGVIAGALGLFSALGLLMRGTF